MWQVGDTLGHPRHGVCLSLGGAGGWLARLGGFTQIVLEATVAKLKNREIVTMKWTKPEAEVVAVTMEVTAYVATL